MKFRYTLPHGWTENIAPVSEASDKRPHVTRSVDTKCLAQADPEAARSLAGVRRQRRKEKQRLQAGVGFPCPVQFAGSGGGGRTAW